MAEGRGGIKHVVTGEFWVRQWVLPWCTQICRLVVEGGRVGTRSYIRGEKRLGDE